ncbi:MAG: hypothetical protein ABIE42_04240 [Candidatus Eisenbacteria bacterium]
MVELEIMGLVRQARDYWHRPGTLLWLWLVITLAVLELDLTSVTRSQAILLTVLLVAALVIWTLSTRLPRAPRGGTGLAVAVVATSRKERELVREDLVGQLSRLLGDSNPQGRFALVEFPQHYASMIRSHKDAARLMLKARCLFIVHGRARERRIGGQQTHILDLDAVVFHGPIPDSMKRALSSEFVELLKRPRVSPDDTLFEVTSREIDLVARYIIGIAAHVFGDLDYALSLFTELQARLESRRESSPPGVAIRQRITHRIAEVHLSLARMHYQRWRSSRAPEDLKQMEPHLTALARIAPGSVETNGLRAILLFALRGDVPGAKKEIMKCKTATRPLWRYSLAFLLAYEGELEEAHKIYRRAVRHGMPAEFLEELEDSICWALAEEPGKFQLYFCLGLINWKVKGDHLAAIRDFETFVSSASPGEFARQVELARAYLDDLSRHLTPEEEELASEVEPMSEA